MEITPSNEQQAQAARLATQAAYLQRWHERHPNAPQLVERQFGRLLLAMCLVLLLAAAVALVQRRPVAPVASPTAHPCAGPVCLHWYSE